MANKGKSLLTSVFIWFLSTAWLRFTIKFFREIIDTLGNIPIPFTLKSIKMKPLKSSITFHLISWDSSVSQSILHPRAATRMPSSKVKPIIPLPFLTLKNKSWSTIMTREFEGDVMWPWGSRERNAPCLHSHFCQFSMVPFTVSLRCIWRSLYPELSIIPPQRPPSPMLQVPSWNLL